MGRCGIIFEHCHGVSVNPRFDIAKQTGWLTHKAQEPPTDGKTSPLQRPDLPACGGQPILASVLQPQTPQQVRGFSKVFSIEQPYTQRWGVNFGLVIEAIRHPGEPFEPIGCS
ncbi:hypothetical protein QQF64_016674 [Cirrhinus molitorella]|uniref:Acrosin n=1 Tax=Cirrhinus molitorella TaxID=172907 RepID=A0ABR3LPU3_9TELE